MNRAAVGLGLLVVTVVAIAILAGNSAGTPQDEPSTPAVPPAATTPDPAPAAASPAMATSPALREPIRQPAIPDQTTSLAERMAAFPQGLHGVVLDRNLMPLVAARVYLLESARNDPMNLPLLRQQGLLMGPVAETQSGRDGTFALGLALASDKLYELRLMADGHADLRIGDLRVLPGEWHDTGQLIMVPGTTVRGHVTVAGTNIPVPGAVVTVEAGTVFEDVVVQGIPGRERGLHAFTAGDGSYTIHNAPSRGVVRISAAAAGFARVIKHDVDLSQEASIQAHFALPPGLTITGRVTDEQNRPIAGARVEGWSAVTSTPPSLDESRTDGSFELVGLRAGKHRVRVFARGYQTHSIADIDAGSRDVAFALLPRAEVAVAVTANGRPLRSYRIGVRRYFPVGGESNSPAAPEFQIGKLRDIVDQRVRLDGMTDRCVVSGLPTGEFVVQVQADGYAKTLSSSFLVAASTRRVEVDVEMSPGATLRGRIVDENDAPLAKASILTQPNGARPDNPVWRMLGNAAPDRITAEKVETGADGTFVLPQLAYGDYQLEIRHPEACRLLVPNLRLAEPGVRDLGTIRLESGALVFGRATIDSRVTGQVKVVLTSVVSPTADSAAAAAAVRLETVTDSSGAYAMPRRVPTGEYELRAAAVDASDPDAQVFQHLMQMQRSAVRFRIAAGQSHFEQHIDVSTQH